MVFSTTTTLNEQHALEIIEASAAMVRSFLNFIYSPDEGSVFTRLKNWEEHLTAISEDILVEAKTFHEHPEAYTSEALISYGEFHKQAVFHPVRIEVRRCLSGEVTQIAVRGVMGAFRDLVLRDLAEQCQLKEKDMEARISGQGSFEVNMRGVNKALPIRYLSHKWEEILDVMQYEPGLLMNARQSRTFVAADGDGTTFDAPSMEGAPTIQESETCPALKAYLESGGVYIILSGNKLDRTSERMEEGIPLDLRKRIVIVADGGALMGVFDENGRINEVKDYVEHGRAALEWQQKRNYLDMIYLGDDGRQNGNDLDAFAETGWDRSILVADLKTNDIIPSLQHRQVGGYTRGTRAVLDRINVLLTKRSSAESSFFTQDCIASLMKYAREV